MGLADAPESHWQARNFDRLLHETWDTETFVFNPASGHTHVLNEAAFALLQDLAVHPSSNRQLARSFGADTKERREGLREQLRQLELVGLICRMPQRR
jgi:PqqD family protein of HPr-rel-A system